MKEKKSENSPVKIKWQSKTYKVCAGFVWEIKVQVVQYLALYGGKWWGKSNKIYEKNM